MEELNTYELELVSAGMSSGTCTALVVGGSSLAGGLAAGYFSGGTMFGAGAGAGGLWGGMLAAYLCY